MHAHSAAGAPSRLMPIARLNGEPPAVASKYKLRASFESPSVVSPGRVKKSYRASPQIKYMSPLSSGSGYAGASKAKTPPASGCLSSSAAGRPSRAELT